MIVSHNQMNELSFTISGIFNELLIGHIIYIADFWEKIFKMQAYIMNKLLHIRASSKGWLWT